MLKDKNILYIVHNYNNFQKDPIEEASKYFKKVYVLVRYKPISKIVKYLPFKSLKKYEDSYVVDLNNVPDNVEVIRTPVWYLPWSIFYKWAGYLHYKAVKSAIKKYKIKFDLIHSHFTWTAGYVGMRLKEDYNKPFIVTGHGFDIYDLPFQSGDWKERIRRILQSADKTLTVSKSNEEIVKELGVQSSDVVTIPNSYNSKEIFSLDKTECRKELGIPQKERVLLSIGNLEEVKGHKYLIDAVKILKKNYPNIRCYIVGGGSLMNFLQRRIEELNLENNVFLIGHVQHKEVNKWINACDLFVLPSLAESFGIVQIEAFACGEPVIATKNEGSKEVITSEEHGYLCEGGDPEHLARKIDKGLKNKWDKEKIIEYSNRFNQEEVSEEIIAIYRNFIEIQ